MHWPSSDIQDTAQSWPRFLSSMGAARIATAGLSDLAGLSHNTRSDWFRTTVAGIRHLLKLYVYGHLALTLAPFSIQPSRVDFSENVGCQIPGNQYPTDYGPWFRGTAFFLHHQLGMIRWMIIHRRVWSDTASCTDYMVSAAFIAWDIIAGALHSHQLVLPHL